MAAPIGNQEKNTKACGSLYSCSNQLNCRRCFVKPGCGKVEPAKKDMSTVTLRVMFYCKHLS